MAITFEELKSRFRDIALGTDEKGERLISTILPVETPDGREAGIEIQTEWLDEGRKLRFSSAPLFNLSSLLESETENAQTALLGLLTGAHVSSVGKPGIDADLNVRCTQTALLEDNTLTSSQLDSILAGLIAGVETTLKLSSLLDAPNNDDPEPGSKAAESLVEKQQQLYRQIETAIMIMERRLGSPEEQEAAWSLINYALKPGNLPAEDQERLRRLVIPIARLETGSRPVW